MLRKFIVWFQDRAREFRDNHVINKLIDLQMHYCLCFQCNEKFIFLLLNLIRCGGWHSFLCSIRSVVHISEMIRILCWNLFYSIVLRTCPWLGVILMRLIGWWFESSLSWDSIFSGIHNGPPDFIYDNLLKMMKHFLFVNTNVK